MYTQATQQSWSISQKVFKAKCEELTNLLCKQSFTFPAFSGYEASELEMEQNQDKIFVQKIVEIEHHEVISDAVGNWLELQNSFLQQLDEHPLYKDKTLTYRKRLVKRYKLAHSNAQLEASDEIKSSKSLYNNTMLDQPTKMDNITPPIEYKNGLIHDAMDDDDLDLKWRVKI